MSEHPLQRTWSFYFITAAPEANWNDKTKHFHDFDTVEGFWSLYNALPQPSNILPTFSLMLFEKELSRTTRFPLFLPTAVGSFCPSITMYFTLSFTVDRRQMGSYISEAYL
ncbi:hypothetical protein GEMRC1_007599 [Eukaryota sp. GEM-RC1]